MFLHSTKAKYCGTNQGGRYTKHVYIGSQRVVSKIGDLDSYGSDLHRIQYAGSETDGLKENSLSKEYLPVNYKDCFAKTLVNKPYMSAKDLFNLMFLQHPKWVLCLIRLRDLIVKPFGLKANKSFENLIVEQNNNEIILGTADKHLTFYVSLFCSDLDNKKQAISISTIVKYKNILGRIYFAAIWIFHRIIVNSLFRRAVKKWLSRDNITTTKD